MSNQSSYLHSNNQDHSDDRILFSIEVFLLFKEFVAKIEKCQCKVQSYLYENRHCLPKDGCKNCEMSLSQETQQD